MADAILNPAKGRKTLVLCPIGLGNFIMATPALEFLSREIGRENLYLLALKSAIGQMAQASDYFQEVLEWDPDREGLLQGMGALWQVRKLRFDYSLAFFPSSHWKFGVFARSAGIRTRIGFAYPHAPLTAQLQDISLPLDVNSHDTHQNLRLVEAFLGKTFDQVPQMRFPIALSHPKEEQLSRTRYFVCHPGSSAERGMAGKRLPPRDFGFLVRRIHREFGLRCVLLGGEEEWMLREQVKRLAPDALFHMEAKTLGELGALIKHSQFFLGNDSGLMHIAVALEKRCIAFFGPTDERRTGPYGYWQFNEGEPYHLVVRNRKLDCAPCWTIHTVSNNPPCKYNDHRCLTEIKVESVWPEIHRWIGSLDLAEAYFVTPGPVST